MGIREAAVRYQAATKDLTDEQKLQVATTLAGTDGMRGLLNVLAQGGKGFDDAKQKVTEMGAAQGAADAQTKGFKGAVDGLKSAWDSWAEAAGSVWLPAITSVINAIANGIPVFDKWLQKVADWNQAAAQGLPDPNKAIGAAGTTATQTFIKQQTADLAKLTELKGLRTKAVSDSKTFLGALKGLFTTGGSGEDYTKPIAALEAAVAKRAKLIFKLQEGSERGYQNSVSAAVKNGKPDETPSGPGHKNTGLASILDGSANKKTKTVKKTAAEIMADRIAEMNANVRVDVIKSRSALAEIGSGNTPDYKATAQQTIALDLYRVSWDKLTEAQKKGLAQTVLNTAENLRLKDSITAKTKATELLAQIDQKNAGIEVEIIKQRDALAQVGAKGNKDYLGLAQQTVALDVFGVAWKKLTRSQGEQITQVVLNTKEHLRLTDAIDVATKKLADKTAADKAATAAANAATKAESDRIDSLLKKTAQLNLSYAAIAKRGFTKGTDFDQFLGSTTGKTQDQTVKDSGIFELSRQQDLFNAKTRDDQANAMVKFITSLAETAAKLKITKFATSDARIAFEAFGTTIDQLTPDIQAKIHSLVPTFDRLTKFEKLKKNLDEIKNTFRDTFRDAFAAAEEKGGNFLKTMFAGFQATIKRIIAEKLANAAVDGIFKVLGKKLGGGGFSSDTEDAKTNLQTGAIAINLSAANLKAAAEAVAAAGTAMSTTGVPGAAGGADSAVAGAVAGALSTFSKSQNPTISASKEAAKTTVAASNTLVQSANKAGQYQMQAASMFAQILPQLLAGGGGKGAVSGAIGSVAGSVIGGIATKQIGGALGSLGGPLGTVLGSLAGGLIGGMFSGKKKFFGLFANGGRPPMGMPSIIGEKGPELWMPDQPGRIHSNSDSKSILSNMGGGGGGVNFNGAVIINDRADVARIQALTLAKKRQKSRLL